MGTLRLRESQLQAVAMLPNRFCWTASNVPGLVENSSGHKIKYNHAN